MNVAPDFHTIAILIPAYNPDRRLTTLVKDLVGAGFTSILVIDDGSAAACAPLFSDVEREPCCHLLRHAVNLGKGRALKTGFNHLLASPYDVQGVVTCDADGQHLVEDVVRIARALVAHKDRLILGVRHFDTAVPLRSRLGNVITRGIFYALVGRLLTDTQTGLRGIPMHSMPHMIRLEGEGYEYEMNMLIAAKMLGLHIIEEQITTVYLENNRSSHFNPLFDSMKIYFLLFRFSSSSLLASILDIILFSICFTLTANILVSIFLGRYTIGPLINFIINRNYVFHHTEQWGKPFLKYFLFATVMGFLAYLLIPFTAAKAAIGIIPAKVIVETFLFIISFTIQRDYIFSHNSVKKSVRASGS